MKKLLKLVLTIIMLSSIVVMMTGCGDDDTSSSKSKKKSNNTTNNSVVEEESTNKNGVVEVEYLGITEYGDFAYKVKNNGKKPAYIESVDTIFKDADGNFVKKEESDVQYFTVEPNSEVVNYAWGYDEDYSQYPNYEFEVKYSDSYMKDYYFTEGFEVTSNDTGKQIAVSVKNNNKKDVESMKVLVAFYNGGKIVGVQTGYASGAVKSGETGYINISYPYDSDYNKVTYDKFETYLLSAYTY